MPTQPAALAQDLLWDTAMCKLIPSLLGLATTSLIACGAVPAGMEDPAIDSDAVTGESTHAESHPGAADDPALAGIADDALQQSAQTTAQVPARRRAWFADYNRGETLEYLDAPYTTLSGDPRYPRAARHSLHQDVAYGPHPRNRLDVWSLDRRRPTPVVVYIHGGGFVGGSKEQVHLPRNTVPRLLAAGLSVVSIDYRYGYEDPQAALLATNPDDEGSINNVNGTRMDYILRDCARAIQFLRYRASELNIDPTRIGVYGNSAGAGCATWVGTVEDLAVRNHPDPVLRQSTRIQAVGHTNGQSTYAYSRWPELLSMDPEFVYDNMNSVRMTQMTQEDLFNSADGRRLEAVLDYYQAMDPSDPPFITINNNPDLPQSQITDASQVIHHPRGHVSLYERCVAMGMDCTIRTRDLQAGPDDDVQAFMVRVLGAAGL